MKLYEDETWTWVDQYAIVIVTNTKNNEKYFKLFATKDFEEDKQKCFQETAERGSKLHPLENLKEWIENKISVK